jgi:CysZ protein
MKDFIAGLTGYPEAHRFILKHRLTHYLLFPGIISMIYLGLLLILAYIYLGSFAEDIIHNWMPTYLQGNVMEIILIVLLWIFLLLLLFITYRHVSLALLSPFLSILSERTECILRGAAEARFSLKQALIDLLRGIRINLRIMILSILFSLAAWLLALLPVVGAFVSLAVSFLIQSYYGGFALFDYTLERKRLSVKKSVAYIKQKRILVTGIGAGFFLLSLIPLIGWFLAPTYGTVAATIRIWDKS